MNGLRPMATLVVCIAVAQALAADDVEPIERWDRAVCLVTEAAGPDGKPKVDLGSAFLVSDDKVVHLVSAAHVARLTGGRTKMLYRNPGGESRWILLGIFNPTGGDPWRYHPKSDLATMRLDTSKLNADARSAMQSLAVPMAQLAVEVPRRATSIEIAGFPISLGTRPEISPLVMRGYVASRRTEAEAKWGSEPIVYALPTVGAGCSGGPAFLSQADASSVRIVGMYVGMVLDNSGVKLSKLVPAAAILEFLRASRD